MPKKDDDIAGFRDFLEGEKKGLSKTLNQGKISKSAGFELLSFLELESSRLDKLTNVMEEKSYVLSGCDSFEKINREINREISLLNSEVLKLLYRKDSPMMKSLEEMFSSLFSS